MSSDPFGLVKQIGNYAIPAFGAFLTVALAVGAWEDTRYLRLVSGFALFTMLSAFVAYWHRLAWLRLQNKPPPDQQNQPPPDQKRPSDLSFLAAVGFMILHFGLILGLIWFVYAFVWFDGPIAAAPKWDGMT